jgi:hypothetical protein
VAQLSVNAIESISKCLIPNMDDSCLANVDFPFPGFPKIRIRGLTGTSGRIIPAGTSGLDENIFAILGLWSHRLRGHTLVKPATKLGGPGPTESVYQEYHDGLIWS